MPRGGPRPNSGRKRGSFTVKTSLIAQQAAALGITPNEVQLATMRLLWAEANKGEKPDLALAERACAIAKDVAPYVHPRISPLNDPESKRAGDTIYNITMNMPTPAVGEDRSYRDARVIEHQPAGTEQR